MDYILKVKDVSKYYKKSNKKEIKALDKINFNLKRGEVLGVIGESGSGKSTLGKLLVGLEEKTKGDIIFEDKDISYFLKNMKLYFRKSCQMIYQNPYDVFDNRYTIEKILLSTLKTHKIGNTKKERLIYIKKIMIDAGVDPPEEFLNRYPYEISGGQLQRISIIRSMLLYPKLIIADEPVSMLDTSVKADVINMLLDMTKKNNSSTIFISHDIPTTRYISDKIAVLHLGKIVEIGDTEDIIFNPKHPYTKALLLSCRNIE